MSGFKAGLSAALALGLVGGAPQIASAQSNENVMIVFDGSNSMWGQIDGVAKIEIARGVMENLLGGWTDERSVGLMAYGHRERGDCTDIETLIPPAPGTRTDILSRINGITPTGKTPLTDAVEQAATAMSYTDTPATVILISDGVESCERDPCALAAALEKGGVGFTAHVVGFGLGGNEDTASLSCIAENTGGEFITAANADELGAALTAVGSAVAAKPEPEEPEPQQPEVTVTGPDTAVIGSAFKVAWTPTLAKNDYITIVPAGAEEGTYGNNLLVRDNSEGELRAPADTGLYELRYLARDGGKTLGSAPIEIVDANVTISGPERVVTGEQFKVSWTGAVDKGDYVAIVPMGAEEGTYGNHSLVRDKSETTLTAQAEPGLYELRYILREGAKTLASQPIEISEPEVTVSGPEKVSTGAEFKATWTGTISNNDYIAIVPMGADEGTYGNHALVRDDNEETLKAQAEPGMYELRYILREGGRTMASQPIEVVVPEVTVSGPESAPAGSPVRISWTGTVADNDYIAIVPMGAEEGTYGNYQLVRDLSEIDLVIPGAPGMYEIRYILREGGKTMASQPMEGIAASVDLSAPEQIRLGDELKVGWSDVINPNDYINLVPMGSSDDTYGAYNLVRDAREIKLATPEATGMYELRYLLRDNGAVIARRTIEVLGADAALNTGASLNAPASGAAGSTIEVAWDGGSGSADQRITLAKADQAIFTWVSAVKIGEGPVQITLPGDPGAYELRFLDVSNQEVLARQTITVE